MRGLGDGVEDGEAGEAEGRGVVGVVQGEAVRNAGAAVVADEDDGGGVWLGGQQGGERFEDGEADGEFVVGCLRGR